MSHDVHAPNRTDRRSFLRVGVAGWAGSMVFGWATGERLRNTLSAEDGPGRTDVIADPNAPWRRGKAKACILVWLSGGPSQLETWDPKPGHRNGGPTKAIETAGGFQIAEHFPQIAAESRDVCLVRTLTSPEGDHSRASYYLHTGYKRSGALTHPSFGALVAKEKGDENAELPHFVSIGGNSYGPGYLGVRYGPFQVADPRRPVPYMEPPADVDRPRLHNRLRLLQRIDSEYLKNKTGEYLEGHSSVRRKALALIDSPSAAVFDVRKEPEAVRAKFGSGGFALQSLMATRLIEKGVPFVETHLGGWDMHNGIFTAVQNRAASLDQGVAGMLRQLRERGLLESTLVVCMGEFGRTPRINRNSGRDHFPRCFSALIAGGGSKGGAVHGRSTPDAMEPKDDPVSIGELYATLLSMLRIDPLKENKLAIGRSIQMADSSLPIEALIG